MKKYTQGEWKTTTIKSNGAGDYPGVIVHKKSYSQVVCSCDNEHVCGLCYESKGYKIINGKLEQTVL